MKKTIHNNDKADSPQIIKDTGFLKLRMAVSLLPHVYSEKIIFTNNNVPQEIPD